MPLLKFENVCFDYKIKDEKVTVLNNINLIVEPGDKIAIMAPSGAGKSSLLYLAGLLDRPSRGEIYYSDQATSSLSDKYFTQLRLAKIGFVYQNHNLLSDFDAINNVAYPLLIKGIGKNEAYELAKAQLKKVGLSNKLESYSNALSGGEQQRVAIARALVAEPQILLADEPTGNLDAENATNFMQLIYKLSEEKLMANIVVTHNLAFKDYFDKIYTINKNGLQYLD